MDHCDEPDMEENQEEDERVVALYSEGVPRRWLFDHLKSEIEQEDACKSLPQALMLWLVFVFMALFHMRLHLLREVSNAVEFDIQENANFAFTGFFGAKDIRDVKHITDFYSWMRNGLVPLVMPDLTEAPMAEDRSVSFEAWPDGAPHMMTRFNAYLDYNKLLGGIRLRQGWRTEGECSAADVVGFIERKCSLSADEQQILQPDMIEIRRSFEAHDETWLLRSSNRSDLFTKLGEMEDLGWWSARTSRVEIAIPIYNTEYGIFSVVYVHLFLSRSGRIYTVIMDESAWATWYHSDHHIFLTFVDGVWCIMVTVMLISEGVEVRRRMSTGKSALYAYVRDFWNIVDWFNIVAGYILIVFFIRVVILAGNLKEEALLFEEPITEANQEQAQTFVDDMETLMMATLDLRRMGSVQPVSLMLRLFKAYSAQPRLAMVTATIGKGATDMFHFAFVFMTIFITYMIGAMIGFGKEFDAFATPGRAACRCFNVLMGDLGWDDLQIAGRFSAFLWMSQFMVLIYLVLLNMLLAIIMDTYSKVKESIGESAETLWSQGYEIYRRWQGRIKRTRVSLNAILQAFPETDHDSARPITVPDLETKVQGIRTQQALRLLGQCYDDKQEKTEEEADIEDVEDKCKSIDNWWKKVAQHRSFAPKWVPKLLFVAKALDHVDKEEVTPREPNRAELLHDMGESVTKMEAAQDQSLLQVQRLEALLFQLNRSVEAIERSQTAANGRTAGNGSPNGSRTSSPPRRRRRGENTDG